MDIKGVNLCSRFAYPPNSLSLCGPDKKNDLLYYSSLNLPDQGTSEILSQFKTLYPYLILIANENKLIDPFNAKVVEAYWLGNRLLNNISQKTLVGHLIDSVGIKKISSPKIFQNLMANIERNCFPHHAFHVLNIYHRTGNLTIPHIVETMDACLINVGKVIEVSPKNLKVKTNKLIVKGNKLIFSHAVERMLLWQGEKDYLKRKIKKGDEVSYHWGYVCSKLTAIQKIGLIRYTNLALQSGNRHFSL
jgi:hypothetical protein